MRVDGEVVAHAARALNLKQRISCHLFLSVDSSCPPVIEHGVSMAPKSKLRADYYPRCLPSVLGKNSHLLKEQKNCTTYVIK
jgi:hypothetical protein